MPHLSQGDIFQAASRLQLAIVFGHIGFNEMRQRWVDFAAKQAQLSHVRDPFTELAGGAVEWAPGKWLWFAEEQENHGMTDAQLTDTLDAALSWASQNGIASVATNGIANTDHGLITADNRISDEQRALYLEDYAKQAEQKYGLAVELISLNDVFIRNRQ